MKNVAPRDLSDLHDVVADEHGQLLVHIAFLAAMIEIRLKPRLPESPDWPASLRPIVFGELHDQVVWSHHLPMRTLFSVTTSLPPATCECCSGDGSGPNCNGGGPLVGNIATMIALRRLLGWIRSSFKYLTKFSNTYLLSLISSSSWITLSPFSYSSRSNISIRCRAKSRFAPS
jgi:hypothetical protein